MFRTTTNVTADMAGAIILGRVREPVAVARAQSAELAGSIVAS
jgi:hypothetical protein